MLEEGTLGCQRPDVIHSGGGGEKDGFPLAQSLWWPADFQCWPTHWPRRSPDPPMELSPIPISTVGTWSPLAWR